MSGWATARWWLLTRALALVAFALLETKVSHDIRYFGRSLAHLHQRGLAHTLVEYPMPGLGVIALPWVLAKVIGAPRAYTALFAFAAIATDAGYTAVLAGRRAHWTAVATWLAGVPLLGAMSYFRFDLVPAVLVGVAVLFVAVRPRLAMASVSVASAVKFWPVVAIPALLGAVRHRWRALALVLVIGGALAAVSLAAAGWSRLVSPLTYEGHRGLQIEAVWATPAMVAWAVGPRRWDVYFSQYKAYEVSGSGVHALLVASTLSGVVLAVALALIWWRMLRSESPVANEQVAWAALAAVTGFVVVGRVLSPQYLLWLLAIAAAGLAVTDGRSARLRSWTVLLLVATGMTHLFFPVMYRGFEHHVGLTAVAVPLLALRNALMLWLLGTALLNAWRPGPSRTSSSSSVASGVSES